MPSVMNRIKATYYWSMGCFSCFMVTWHHRMAAYHWQSNCSRKRMLYSGSLLTIAVAKKTQKASKFNGTFCGTLLFSDNYRMCLETSDPSIINILFTKQLAITVLWWSSDKVPFCSINLSAKKITSHSTTKMTILDRSWPLKVVYQNCINVHCFCWWTIGDDTLVLDSRWPFLCWNYV